MCIRRWRSLPFIVFVTSLSQVHPVLGAEEETRTDSNSPPRCAFIAQSLGPREALIEAELLADARFSWVERALINRVLDEQKLQALFTPAGFDQRSGLGQLLRADLLVLLRQVKDDSSATEHLELVISENTRGLRLVRTVIPETESTKTSAAILQSLARAAQMMRSPLKAVYAVPPLMSNNLTDDFAYLKKAYAYVIEEVLMSQPGILVVEFAEAHALANELAIAGGGEPVARSMPVYIIGSFRHEGAEQARRIVMQLKAVRQERTLKELPKVAVAPEKVTEYLRAKAAELAGAAAGGNISLATRGVEAKQLAARGNQFSDTGQWLEAADIYEASLLLDPADVEVLQRQITVLSNLTWSTHRQWIKKRLNISKFSEYLDYRERAWTAIERLYASHPRPHRLPHHEILNTVSSVQIWPHYKDLGISETAWQRSEALAQLQQDVLINIVRRVVTDDPNPGQTRYTLRLLNYYLAKLPGRERAGLLRAIDAIAATPHARQYAIGLAEELPGYELSLYPSSRTHEHPKNVEEMPPTPFMFQLVDKLQASPHEQLRQAATDLGRRFKIANLAAKERQELEKQYAVREAALKLQLETARRRYVEHMANRSLVGGTRPSQSNPPETGLRVPRPVAIPDPSLLSAELAPNRVHDFRSGEVLFRAIQFQTGVGNGTPRIDVGEFENIFPVTEGVDVFASDQGALSLMREKGKLNQVWKSPHSSQIWCACFDSRYIWVSTKTVFGDNPHAVVIELNGKQLWELGDREGLPFPKPDREAPGPALGANRFLLVSPLEPGKVWALGSFGRSWIGTLSFSPQSGIKVDVLHESHQLPGPFHKSEFAEQWRDIQAGIIPLGAVSLPAAEPPHSRLLIIRSASFSPEARWFEHPILCDYARRTCEVVMERIPGWRPHYYDPATVYGQDAGHLYALDREGQLIRFDDADFRRQHVVARLPNTGLLICHKGLFHVAGKRWITGRLSDGKVLVDAEVPWKFKNNEESFDTRPGASLYLDKLCRSNHHGLIAILAPIGVQKVYSYYQVVLPDLETPRG